MTYVIRAPSASGENRSSEAASVELRTRGLGVHRRVSKFPNPIDQHVGSRVRMQRMLRGLSQEKLGEALGVTFQQVQKYEKGANRIGASRLQQISKILDIPPSFFFEGSPSPSDESATGFEESPTAFIMDFLSTAEGLQLNRSFQRIPSARLRKRLVDLIATLADVIESAPENKKEAKPKSKA